MKTNHGRLLVVLLFAGLLVGIGGCGGKQERLAAHLEKGRAYYLQAEYGKARIEIRNVLQIDPKSGDAYYLLGLMDEAQNEWQRAFADYSKAVEFGHAQAKIRLGRLNLLAGKLDQAELISSEALAVRPNDPGARFLKAALLARRGDVDAAIREATRIVADAPTETDAISLLAGLYAQRGNDAKAMEVLEAGIQANPRAVALQKDMLAVASRRKDSAKVEKSLLDIIAIEPRDIRHRVELANYYVRAGQLDRAENALRSAIAVDPDDAQRHLLLVEFLAAKKGAQDAEKELRSSIQAKPSAYALQFALAKLYEVTGKPQESEQTYRTIIETAKGRPEVLKAKVLLARSTLARGDVAGAEKLVAEVLTENPQDTDGLQLRARMYLAKGDARQSIPDLRVVLRDRPDSLEVISLLSSAYVANGEPQLAKDVYANAIVRYPGDTSLRKSMATFLAGRGEFADALKELDAAQNIDPRDHELYILKARLQAQKQDLVGAEQTLKKMKSAFPGDADGAYWLGELYVAQRKFDQAGNEFELALKNAPNAIAPLAGIVAVLLQQGKPDKAVARINAFLQTSPENAQAYALLGSIYARQKRYADAEAALRRVIAIDPRASAPYVGLANLYLMQGNAASAVELLQQQSGAGLKDPLRLHYALAETYLKAGQRDKAIAEYETILKKDPRAQLAANNVAALLSEGTTSPAELDRALALAKQFENSTNPTYVDTLGWIYYRLGDLERALPLLRKAVAMGPNAPDRQYHLGMALVKQGDTKAARTHLQLAIDSKADFPGIEEAKATLARL